MLIQRVKWRYTIANTIVTNCWRFAEQPQYIIYNIIYNGNMIVYYIIYIYMLAPCSFFGDWVSLHLWCDKWKYHSTHVVRHILIPYNNFRGQSSRLFANGWCTRIDSLSAWSGDLRVPGGGPGAVQNEGQLLMSFARWTPRVCAVRAHLWPFLGAVDRSKY